MSEPTAPNNHIVTEIRFARQKVLSIAAVVIIAGILLSFTIVLAQMSQTASLSSSATSSPTTISYQGRVWVNGQPYNGMGQFRFAIVNNAATLAYWSNDGTGLANPPFTPTASVTLSVSNGLFNVRLGDTTLAGMTRPITQGIFLAPERSLRVWFNDGVNGFQRLTPDVVLAAVPYALNAETLDGLDSGEFAGLSHVHSASDITGTIPEAKIDPSLARDSEIVPAVEAAGFLTTELADARYARIGPNPKQLALLRWYTAISTPQTFAVGSFPAEIAFDGANLWVSNYAGGASSTVSVLRASDGALVATYPAGNGPQGIAFDGANMWIANGNLGNTVTVLRASDGFQVMTPTVGTGPLGIAFDGSRMWVTNFYNSNVSVLRVSDGQPVMTPTVGTFPYGLAFEGVNMWVTNFGFNGTGNTVSVLRASDGAHVMTVTVGQAPRHLAFDGANMWVTNEASNNVSVIRASDGFHVMTPTVGIGPIGIAFDGANMWVANGGLLSGNTVSVLRVSDGALIATIPVGLSPSGIAFDGANMWVTNYGEDTVSKR